MTQVKPIRPVPPFVLPIEGRLLAHRRLLVELMRNLPRERREKLLDWMGERALYQEDAQEPSGDPPGEGIELELARADEFQVLKRMVEAPHD